MKNSLHLLSEPCQYETDSLPLEFSEDKHLFIFDYSLTAGHMGAVFRDDIFSHLPTSKPPGLV